MGRRSGNILISKFIFILILVYKILYKAWFCKKHFFNILENFFNDTYVYVLKEKRNNIDIKSEKCVFMVYKEGVKGLRFGNW